MLEEKKIKHQNEHEDIYKAELKGFSKSFAEVEWLLVILVLLYIKLPGTVLLNENNVILASIIFTLFILIFHYLILNKLNTKWKLAAETWAMISFITYVVWNTGRIESPLLSLYLLVIITAATALGKRITLLEVCLISACCFLLSFSSSNLATLSVSKMSSPLIQLFPLWFVAYLVSMLARETDIAKQKILKLSQTDYLTGLWNMRSFTALVETEHKRAARHSHPYTILMLDADNLKPINDTYGHEYGSRMIKLISSVIMDAMRGTDIIARYGGDEFVALLPETDASGGYQTAERIRKKLLEKPLNTPAGNKNITISIGIATNPDHDNDPLNLMKKADMAMYRSKKNGKDQSTIYL